MKNVIKAACIATTLIASPSFAGWSYDTSTDDMTDEVSSTAQSEVGIYKGGYAVVAIMCSGEGNGLSLLVNYSEYIAPRGANVVVSLRFDGGDVLTIEGMSYKEAAIIPRNSVSTTEFDTIINALSSGNTLRFQVASSQYGRSATREVSLRKSSEAIDRVVSDCQ